MATITCPSCKSELTEYTRFCPECGARLPDPQEAAPEAPAGRAAAPTVLLPPSDAPSRSDAPPAVPPTARLDAPDAPTVLLPPSGDPARPYAPPEPPYAQQPPADTPSPTPYAQQPPAFSGQLPPAAGFPAGSAAPASPPNRRTLWWILGGAGCLGLLLVGACAIFALVAIGSTAATDLGVTTPPTSAPIGGGGVVPGDSPLTGGDVLLRDDFDDAAASGLGEDEDSAARYAYEGGAYVIEVKEPETIVWTGLDGRYDDARVGVDVEVPPGADVSAAGLIFHYQDPDNFYLFSITNDGYYALELLENDEWITLIDWTLSDAVSDGRNRMQVETQGDRIALYVNDVLLEETSDGTFTQGEVALAVSSLQDSTAEVHFDNLLIERNR